VEAYGALATLSKVAQVSVRDPRVLLVSVFDSAMSTAVERAIRGAGLNLNPSVESASAGRIVVPVPRPTKETREAMRKVCRCGAFL
jgi:ribosome recycling factor